LHLAVAAGERTGTALVAEHFDAARLADVPLSELAGHAGIVSRRGGWLSSERPCGHPRHASHSAIQVQHVELITRVPLLPPDHAQAHRAVERRRMGDRGDLADLVAVPHEPRPRRRRPAEYQATEPAIHVAARRAARDHLLAEIAALRGADRRVNRHL